MAFAVVASEKGVADHSQTHATATEATAAVAAATSGSEDTHRTMEFVDEPTMHPCPWKASPDAFVVAQPGA